MAHLITQIHMSPIGVIPKKHKLKKWRLICDLSSTEHYSVNDRINVEESSMKYSKVQEAIAQVQKLGQGALLEKIDIKDAYHIIPINHQDKYLPSFHTSMVWSSSDSAQHPNI